jgi:hypothetical protein
VGLWKVSGVSDLRKAGNGKMLAVGVRTGEILREEES